MIRKVLYPTDFSSASEKGISVLEELKSLGVEEIVLMHVIDLNRLIGPASGIDIPAVIHDYEEEASQNLKVFSEKIEERGLKVVTADLKAGEPSIVICEMADELGVDLIAIPSHGKGVIAEVLLGSVSEGVVRKSNKPVLVIKLVAGENGEIKAEFDRLFRKILLAYDFTEMCEDVVEYVSFFAEKGGSEEVLIVHVVEKGKEVDERMIEKLEEIEGRFKKLGVKSEIFIEAGTPYKEILRVADERDVSMIAISSRGASLLRSIFGGNAEGVVRRSKIPVFVYKR